MGKHRESNPDNEAPNDDFVDADSKTMDSADCSAVWCDN